MKKDDSEILDEKILDLFVEHMATVLECEANQDPDKVAKLDSLRVARHRELCEKLGVNYDGLLSEKDKVVITNFSEKRLNEWFGGDLLKAAKYKYRAFLDEKNAYGSSSIKTHYTWFPMLRKNYEDIKAFADEELKLFEEGYEKRKAWWYEVTKRWSDQKTAKALENAGFSFSRIASMHDFNGVRYSIQCKLEVYDKFTADLKERDLTVANCDAYVFERKDLDMYLGKIALESWHQERKFAEAKEFLKNYVAESNDRKK